MFAQLDDGPVFISQRRNGWGRAVPPLGGALRHRGPWLRVACGWSLAHPVAGRLSAPIGTWCLLIVLCSGTLEISLTIHYVFLTWRCCGNTMPKACLSLVWSNKQVTIQQPNRPKTGFSSNQHLLTVVPTVCVEMVTIFIWRSVLLYPFVSNGRRTPAPKEQWREDEPTPSLHRPTAQEFSCWGSVRTLQKILEGNGTTGFAAMWWPSHKLNMQLQSTSKWHGHLILPRG